MIICCGIDNYDEVKSWIEMVNKPLFPQKYNQVEEIPKSEIELKFIDKIKEKL